MYAAATYADPAFGAMECCSVIRRDRMVFFDNRDCGRSVHKVHLYAVCVLTVNIIGYEDHIGSRSKRLIVGD